MTEPSILFLSLLIVVCLLLAMAGLFLLVNFKSLFRGSIRNEVLRKNLVAWLAIFCISGAMTPMSNSFFFILYSHGWASVINLQLVSTTAYTLFIYNAARYTTEHRSIKNISYAKHNLVVYVVIMVMTILINLSILYLFDYGKQFIRNSIISSIYLSGTTSLIYMVIRYLDIERK